MPEGHWDWSMPVTLSQGWRTDELLFVGGQISADPEGRAVGADLETQTRNIMTFMERVLEEGGAGFGDVVKLNVYYVVDENSPPPAEILARIDGVLSGYFAAPGPVLTETPVPGLAFEGLLLEIDAVAAVGADRRPLAWSDAGRANDSRPYSPGWRVGDWVFVGAQRSLGPDGALLDAGDIGAQTRRCFESMGGLLAAAGGGMGDLARLNTYYQFEGAGRDVTAFWERMTEVRLGYLPNPGPSGTAVRVTGFPHEGELFQIESIAHLGTERRRLMPAGHWDWSMAVPFSQGWRIGNAVFCGGQISADRNGAAVGAGDIALQTRNVFDALTRVLAEGGASMEDVVKLNTYYTFDGTGRAVTDYWEEMTAVRKDYFPPEAAAATAVRVQGYAFEELLIEVEAVAVVED